MNATATSAGNTIEKKPDSGLKRGEKPVNTRIKLFTCGNTKRCMQNRESEEIDRASK